MILRRRGAPAPSPTPVVRTGDMAWPAGWRRRRTGITLPSNTQRLEREAAIRRRRVPATKTRRGAIGGTGPWAGPCRLKDQVAQADRARCPALRRAGEGGASSQETDPDLQRAAPSALHVDDLGGYSRETQTSDAGPGAGAHHRRRDRCGRAADQVGRAGRRGRGGQGAADVRRRQVGDPLPRPERRTDRPAAAGEGASRSPNAAARATAEATFRQEWAERNPTTPNPKKFAKLIRRERKGDPTTVTGSQFMSLAVPVEFPNSDTFDAWVTDPDTGAGGSRR